MELVKNLHNKRIGSQGEVIAKQYLTRKGYRILDQNYKLKWGELDLVVERGGRLIFVEVKTQIMVNVNGLTKDIRQGKDDFVNSQDCCCLRPEDNITFKKQKQLQKMALSYLAGKKYPYEKNWQIDIIAIELNLASRRYRLRHLKNVIFE